MTYDRIGLFVRWGAVLVYTGGLLIGLSDDGKAWLAVAGAPFALGGLYLLYKANSAIIEKEFQP